MLCLFVIKQVNFELPYDHVNVFCIRDTYLQNKFLINVALCDAGLEVWIL